MVVLKGDHDKNDEAVHTPRDKKTTQYYEISKFQDNRSANMDANSTVLVNTFAAVGQLTDIQSRAEISEEAVHKTALKITNVKPKIY